LHDHGIVVRGGVAVGQATKSYRRIFGPAVIRAYEIESKEAKYPRIVVDPSVLDEVEINNGLWVHDKESELEAVNGFLRTDDEDGLRYVDYLRVIRDELDDPSDYEDFLRAHGALVSEKLKQHANCQKIRLKSILFT
jgi:hypothetical protein